MTKAFIVLVAFCCSCSVGQAALLKNFAASYAKYQACSVLMPAAKCYKLYCDPEGIQEGQITAYVDVPDPGGVSRFDLGPPNGIESTHPLYTAVVSDVLGNPSITTLNGRQRYEAKVSFRLIPGFEPPGGEIVIFELHVHDLLPQLGLAGVEVGFEFDAGDFVTIFTPGSQPQFTTFDDTQLDDVPLMLQVPEPGSLVLAGCGLASLGWTIRRRRRSR